MKQLNGFKSCYELNIDISDDYRDYAVQVFTQIEFSAQQYVAPDCHRKDFPKLWEPLQGLRDWVSPKVKIFNHAPCELGTSKIHMDVNDQGQYDNILPGRQLPKDCKSHEWHKRLNQFVIIQGSVNIPLFEPCGEITRWYRAKEPANMHPYDFWLGKTYKMEIIDEFEIGTKPVLFRTGVWHAVDNIRGLEDSPRMMLSFSALYTVDWDTLVNVAKNENLLLNRD